MAPEMPDGPPETLPAPPAADDGVELTRFLAGRDVPCPLCGYNLRGLTTPRCPECGRELRLSIGLTEPYLRAWIVLAAAACASGGTGLFFVMMIARAGWPSTFGSPARIFVMNCSLMYFILTIPVAVAVLVARRRLLRLPAGLQWLLAWLAVAGSTAAMIGFAAVVR
jgi:hypothetical protein